MPLLVCLFVALPLAELYLLVRIGKVVGAFETLAMVLAVGVLGAWLAKSQGRRVIDQWRSALAEGRVPEEGVLSGVLVLVGGLLLVTPGVLTDVVGLSLLIPALRRRVSARLRAWLSEQVMHGRVQVSVSGGRSPREPESPRVHYDPRLGTVIDVQGESVP